MARFQRGSLRVESRKNGQNWVLRYYVTRMSDGRRVEHKIPVGLVRDFPTESVAWAEVERQHLQLNGPDFQARMTFSHLAQHFMTHELGEQTETADPKSHTTIAGYKRILKNRCIDRWGKRAALSLEPLEIEQWLKALKQDEDLANPTARQDTKGDESGLQARATLWADSPNSGSKPYAVRSLQNDQRLRSDDSDSKAGV